MRAAEVEFALTRQKWEREDRADIQYENNIIKLRRRMNMGRFDTRTRTHGTPKYMMWGKQQLKQPMKRKSMALDHKRKNAI